jgi:ribonuclease P protein subunit POP4
MITSYNLKSHEMIGLKTEITHSTNQQIMGLNGIIVDETKNMFVLKTQKGMKRLPKVGNTWRFSLKNEQKEIEGASLSKRSFDRLGGK